MKKHRLGIAALVIGVIALGLAVIPGIALDRPLPFAKTTSKEQPPTASGAKSSVSVTFNKFSVTIGREKKADNNDTSGENKRDSDVTADGSTDSVDVDSQRQTDRNLWLKWFTISAACCALIGLILAPLSWAQEKQYALAGSAVGICCLALVWQYVVVGIAVGVAMVIVLVVLSHFAS